MFSRPIRSGFRAAPVMARKPLRAASSTPSAAMLALLAAAPDGPTWIKVNTNTVASVFPATGFIASYNGTLVGNSLATAVIRCWSGFAWDVNHCRLIIYGGGHGNYDGNEVYVFDGATRQWKLGFYPSDVTPVVFPSEQKSVDGDLAAPVSSHTYGNNQYLPVLDKFVTFGGAAANTGACLLIRDDPPGAPVLRPAGCFTLDMTLYGQGYVAGHTGSNVQHGDKAGVVLPGAQAWQCRDWIKDHSAASVMLTNDSWYAHKSCGAAYRKEGGKDVLYKYTNYSQQFWRIQFNDSDYHNDQIDLLGSDSGGGETWDNAPAMSPDGLFVALGGEAFRLHGYNVADWTGPGGSLITKFQVSDSGINDSAAKTEFLGLSNFNYQKFGIVYDTINNHFVLWNGGGRTFALTHGGGSLNSNWDLTKISDDTGVGGTTMPYVRDDPAWGSTAGDQNGDTSTLGKWKWAPNLNCAIGLQHDRNGDVWLYKPVNWVAPT